MQIPNNNFEYEGETESGKQHHTHRLLFGQIILPQNQPLPSFRNILMHLTILSLDFVVSTSDNVGNGGTQPRVMPHFT